MMFGLHQAKTVVLCYSQSDIYLSKDHVFHDKTKYIDVWYHFIHTEKRIKVNKIGTLII